MKLRPVTAWKRLGVVLGVVALVACGDDKKGGTSNSTQVAAPTFTPAGGTFTAAQYVTIASSTPGATIRYTIDGTTPSSTVGTEYSAPLEVASTTSIKAIAYKSGMADSVVVSKTFNINTAGIVSAPKFEPDGGEFLSTVSVKITTDTSGATIHYTTDGSPPSASAGTTYTGEITVSQTTTIKAIATQDGLVDSAIVSKTFTAVPSVDTPTFSTPGNVTSATGSLDVTINDTTSGATIAYTTDANAPLSCAGATLPPGTVVTLTDTTGPITIKAIACKSGLNDSSIATSPQYTITAQGVIVAPSFSPGATTPVTTYVTAQTITLSTSSSTAQNPLDIY